jgi:hypothetical protein
VINGAAVKILFRVTGFTILLVFFWLGGARSAPAADGAPGRSEPAYDPGALCLPAAYLSEPGDCAVAGPAGYLTRLAEQGFTFPVAPLQAQRPDFGLTAVNTRYGQVVTPNAPVFASLEDAVDGDRHAAPLRIDSPFAYISYVEEAMVEGRRFYKLEEGQWMTANDVSRLSAVPLFQGLEFQSTPQRAFGWALTLLSPGLLETRRTPGYKSQDFTGHVLNNHDLVWVYATQVVDGEEWYLVGPDEWVHHNAIARVLSNTTPPEGVSGARWIEVNLFEQTLAVYEDGELVFATLIASGLEPFWTRPGLFQITEKLPTTPMRGAFEVDRSDAYYLEDVPWTMYFDQARALHGAYWRAHLGFPQSHGCVNLSVGDSH